MDASPKHNPNKSSPALIGQLLPMILRRKQIRPDNMADGTHAVKITRAASKTSQNDNEMLQLVLEDLLSGEVAKTNLVFSPKTGFTIDTCFKSLNLEMPEDGEFFADKIHFRGRTVFSRTETEETAEYGVQIRVRWISKKTAVKDDPRLEAIPESEPLMLPALAAGAVPQTPKPRNVPRMQSSWPVDEAEAKRQAAEAEANRLYLQDDLDMGPSPEPSAS